jgi:hypothetical protein
LAQRLKDTPFFFVPEVLLDFALFLPDALALWREPRGRHVEQDVGAIPPVDGGLHGVKAARGNILKAPRHLDIFMKPCDCPTQAISEDDLACRGFAIITGEGLAATLRSFFGL